MKKHNFDCMQFIKKIVDFSPRQYAGEIKTADFIENFLKERKIPFQVQLFKTKVPIEKKAVLKIDGKSINCKSVCFVSGRITKKVKILSSRRQIDEFSKTPAIIFNPDCKGISCAVFFHNVPAVSVSRKDISKIKNAKNIQGEVKIKPISYTARNILVGNTKNPRSICFAHYDSILTGAWDNAGSNAVLMANILWHPETLKNNLFVFTANEELSYDKKPGYWCRGFRFFENKYLHLLKNVQKIIVVDGVGTHKSYWMKEYKHLWPTILIKNLKKFQPRIIRLGTTSKTADQFYHSELDNISNIKKKYILQTIEKLNKKVNEK